MDRTSQPTVDDPNSQPAAPVQKRLGPPPPPPPRAPVAAWNETTQVEGLPEVTSKVTWEPVEKGQTIAGLTLTEQCIGQSGSPVWTVWKAQDANGSLAVIYALNSDIYDKEHHRFVQGAKTMLRITRNGTISGVLKCYGLSRDRRALIAQYLSVGRATDVSALRWTTQRSITFLQSVCGILETLHQQGITHSCLRPGNILLDDDFSPILTEVGFLNIAKSLKGDQDNTHGYGAYAAPEIVSDSPPTVKSDIYSLGKILLFLLSNEHPKTTLEATPLLTEYKKYPEGLVRIARRCTMVNPELRYQSVAELASDLSQYTQVDTVGMALRTSLEQKPVLETKEIKDTSASLEIENTDAAFGMNDKIRYMTVAAGVLGVAIVMGLAFVLPITTLMHKTLLGCASVFAALCTLALPASPRYRRYGFVAVGTAAGLFFYQLDPIAITAIAGAKSRLDSSNPQLQSAAVRYLTTQGFRDFSNKNLKGADLSGADLNFVNFQRTDLTKANLSKAMVQGTVLDGATITEANLSDVVAVDWNIDTMKGFEQARCNSNTMMPVGWNCRNNSPARLVNKAQRNRNEKEESN